MKTDNELIAEFMGAEFIRKPHVFYPDRYTETYIFIGHPGNWRVEKEIKSHMTAPMLCYHTDWDWLMPVVIKCHEIGDEKERVFPEDKDLDDPTGWRAWSYQRVGLSTNIEHTYKNVVNFIKWYNKETGKELVASI